MGQKAFISGPMRKRVLFNFPAFDAAAKDLREQGYEVISPADMDRARGFDPSTLPADHDWSTIPEGMDLKAIILEGLTALSECDCVVLLPWWRVSLGSVVEVALARFLGLQIMIYESPEDSQ